MELYSPELNLRARPTCAQTGAPATQSQPEETMKAALVAVVFFATAAFAQETALVATQAACGPGEVQFNAEPAKELPPAQPEAGKSLVYVVEVFDKAVNELSRPTLRVGVDGKWVGADRPQSYLAFSVEPGEHHLCTRWQSRLKRFSDKAAFALLAADPGKVYYFRARIIEGYGSNFALDFAPVNEDEGKFLIASSAPSVSQPKK
jgi:hypothetical protein